MSVKYVTHSGNDILVVNSARVSFSKESMYDVKCSRCGWDFNGPLGSQCLHGLCTPEEVIRDEDERLIKYLATHNHWTPFSHPTLTLRVKAPVFVARQLFKHKVGMTENEVSRRYVSDEPELFTPTTWRKAPTNGAKQGSSDEEASWTSIWAYEDFNDDVRAHYDDSLSLYNRMIEDGVAPEQARMVLPQSMYTEWFWTGSLAAYARICNLRLDPHAQKETQEVVKSIYEILSNLYPVSCRYLIKECND